MDIELGLAIASDKGPFSWIPGIHKGSKQVRGWGQSKVEGKIKGKRVRVKG